MRQQQQQDMDVTFTNVLEGARQYFQGLPAAQDSASGGPPSSRSYDHGAIAACYTNAVKPVPNNAVSAATSRSDAEPHPTYVQGASNARVNDDTPHIPYNMQHNYWMPQEVGESTKDIGSNSNTNKQHERLQELSNMDANCRTNQSVPNHSQESSKTIQNYQYQQSQTPSSQSYQSYSRIQHPMENSNSLHYSTPYSHSSQAQNIHQSSMQQQSQPNQHRSSSRSQEQKIHYPQMEPPKSHIPSPHANNVYMNGYPQTASYYPPHSKPQSPAAPPPTSQAYLQHSSSQVHNNNNNQYPSYSMHSQSPVQSQTQYRSAVQNEIFENKELSNIHMHIQNSQQRRNTHNLPPIAALSSVNYHSNKGSREVQRVGTVQRHRSQSQSYTSMAVPTSLNTTATTLSSTIYSSSQQQIARTTYSQQTNHSRSTTYTSAVHSNPTPQYPINNASNNEHHSRQYQQYPVASSASYPSTSVNSSSSSKQIVYPQSSYTQYFQKFPKAPSQQEISTQKHISHISKEIHPVSNRLPETMTNTSSSHLQRTDMSNVLAESMNPKQKRESPLDLSVKTVRTSADSTALDDSENHNADIHRFNKAFKQRIDSKPVFQTVPNASNGTYIKDNHGINHQRNLMRTTNVPSSGAPKVDFLPNFSVPALHQQNSEIHQQNLQHSNKMNEHSVLNQNKLARNIHEREYYQRQNSYQLPATSHQNNVRPNSVSNSTYHINTDNKPVESLPRYDFTIDGNGYKKTPMTYTQTVRDTSRKRLSESESIVPNKMPKMDSWRQTIDQQIEQKLSSYTNSRLQQEQHYKQQITNAQFAKPINNHSKLPTTFVPNTHNQQFYPQQTQYRNNSQYTESQPHNHTYIPEANQQHFQSNIVNQNYDMYLQNTLHRSNSTSKLHSKSTNNMSGVTDKRILSILRNNLENKGAKEAQKKLEAVKPINVPNNQSGVQHPSTDVSAPLQPKHIRHNISPFTASSLLERSSNTPPSYKFHFPRAVDSVKFESDTVIKDERDNMPMYPNEDMNIAQNNNIPPTGATDLDGLAAFLAARIRTKAELKQVGPSQEQKIVIPSVSQNVQVISGVIGGSPPKLSREQIPPPRRKLFNKSEEDAVVPPTVSNGNLNVPLRNTNLRSSSETSVFDFRDSDSEGEMPVLERQSLHDMRRDRKSHNKSLQPQPIVEPIVEDIPIDTEWEDVCGKFVEQLQNNSGKKRGRRKKIIEPEVIAKLETVTKENPLPEIANLDIVKKENDLDVVEEEAECKKKEETPIIKQEKIEIEETNTIDDGSDSDAPLINNINKRTVIKKEENLSEDEEVSMLSRKNEKITAKIHLDYSSDSDSDNVNSDKVESVSRKLFTRKSKLVASKLTDQQKQMVLRSADSSPIKKTIYLKKKAIFGDGSDFHPGWEEEVYRYKRSIRMPASLITVSRPHWHRMSTSLPDLDACSPAPSSLTDDTEFTSSQRKSFNSSVEAVNLGKVKRELLLDSDMDSNSSFSFSQKNAYDSEEASCSSLKTMKKTDKSQIKKENNNSIVDVLVERCSKLNKLRKNKLNKDKKNGPKIIQKSSNPLLPTPSLGIGNDDKKDKPKRGRMKQKDKEKEKDKDDAMELNNSVYLGFFRKETVNNFIDTFKKNSSGFMGMGDSFSTIVLKSRTRTETRVMKKRATIREVFGEDRPASAPPMTVHEDDNIMENEKPVTESEKISSCGNIIVKNKEIKITSIREGLRSATTPTKKVYNVYKRKNTNNVETKASKSVTPESKSTTPDSKIEAKSIASESKSVTSESKSVISEIFDDKISIKSETQSVIDDEVASDISTIPTKKRLKLRNIRRKFSSGFDYIRKKKKIIKKESSSVDEKTDKPRRRGFLPRPSPESESDIQKEIKTWVMNKGVGETHLHRAARLGYTVS